MAQTDLIASVWRSEGYAEILTVEDKRFTIYYDEEKQQAGALAELAKIFLIAYHVVSYSTHTELLASSWFESFILFHFLPPHLIFASPPFRRESDCFLRKI